MYFNDLKKLSDKTPTVFSILKYFSITFTCPKDSSNTVIIASTKETFEFKNIFQK